MLISILCVVCLILQGALMSFSKLMCLAAITGSKFAPSGLTERNAVQGAERLAKMVFLLQLQLAKVRF